MRSRHHRGFGGRERQRQEHRGAAAAAPLRPRRRRRAARRRRPAEPVAGLAAQPGGLGGPEPHPLCLNHLRKHRAGLGGGHGGGGAGGHNGKRPRLHHKAPQRVGGWGARGGRSEGRSVHAYRLLCSWKRWQQSKRLLLRLPLGSLLPGLPACLPAAGTTRWWASAAPASAAGSASASPSHVPSCATPR